MKKAEKLAQKGKDNPAPRTYKTVEEASAAKCKAAMKTLEGVDLKKVFEQTDKEAVG